MNCLTQQYIYIILMATSFGRNDTCTSRRKFLWKIGVDDGCN